MPNNLQIMTESILTESDTMVKKYKTKTTNDRKEVKSELIKYGINIFF